MKASQKRRRTATILIDDQFCKGCNLCLQVCPQKLFSKGEKRSRGGYRMPQTSDTERCSGCLLCEMTCPDLALTVVTSELLQNAEHMKPQSAHKAQG